MKALLLLTCVLLFACVATPAQKKGWTEWDNKEVEHLLNSSSWGQTQTQTKPPVTFHVRLFSAKPIRQAFARKMLLSNPAVKPEQLNSFINGDFTEYIIVAVTAESSDRRLAMPIVQTFTTATADTLKETVYLESADGKRIALDKYVPPTSDGTGAKFVFPKVSDGKPLFAGDQTFRFVADISESAKIAWKFKLPDMMYDGKLEY